MKESTMKKLNLTLLTVASVSFIAFTGCANKTQSGAAIGAGTGALIGQAVGGNTGATLIGAGVGAVAGGLIGNNEDKKDAARRGY